MNLSPEQTRFLQQQGFSSGLIHAFSHNAALVPFRWWIVDNSISMMGRDAHVVAGSVDKIIMMDASRWEEVKSCVHYHSHLAGMFRLSSRFTILNSATGLQNPVTVSVAERGPELVQQDLQQMDHILQSTIPTGATPITHHLLNIREVLAAMVPQLNGRRVTILLATDGLPSTEHCESQTKVPEFIQALQSLIGLPVWIVIRLCTDDEKVFDFYNSLDVNLNIDVLDDLVGEAIEVYLHNPWLTYGLPLHRLREMGFLHPVVDALDEYALTFAELRSLCLLLFAIPTLPDPTTDWIGFLRALIMCQSRERMQWNPVTKHVSPWIDIARLHAFYGRGIPLPQDVVAHYQFQTQGTAQQRGRPHGVPHTSHGTAPPATSTPASTRRTRSATSEGDQSFQEATSTQSTDVAAAKSTGEFQRALKDNIMRSWALQPPAFVALQTVPILLATVHTTFPPNFGVPTHEYFNKFKPFSSDAIASNDPAVLQRGMMQLYISSLDYISHTIVSPSPAVRKMKFFLHPDKLPRDLTSDQLLLCRVLWDTLANAWEISSS